MSTLEQYLGMKKPFRMLEEEVFLNLKVCLYGLSQALDLELKHYRLTDVTYNILRILRGAGEDGLPCADISKRMLSRVPDVTRLVDRLEKLEYVIRDRKLGDRRVVLQKITEKGLDILQKLDGITYAIYKSNFNAFQESDLRQLNVLLDQLRNSILQ